MNAYIKMKITELTLEQMNNLLIGVVPYNYITEKAIHNNLKRIEKYGETDFLQLKLNKMFRDFAYSNKCNEYCKCCKDFVKPVLHIKSSSFTNDYKNYKSSTGRCKRYNTELSYRLVLEILKDK